MKKALLLMSLLPSIGCLHAARLNLVIPSRCVGINIQSFTQPCTPLADGKFVCNGVVITANCVEMARRKISNEK